ncbi:unnamed protein product, partial [Amoebophrya sp. A25]
KKAKRGRGGKGQAPKLAQLVALPPISDYLSLKQIEKKDKDEQKLVGHLYSRIRTGISNKAGPQQSNKDDPRYLYAKMPTGSEMPTVFRYLIEFSDKDTSRVDDKADNMDEEEGVGVILGTDPMDPSDSIILNRVSLRISKSSKEHPVEYYYNYWRTEQEQEQAATVSASFFL